MPVGKARLGALGGKLPPAAFTNIRKVESKSKKQLADFLPRRGKIVWMATRGTFVDIKMQICVIL